MPTPIKILLASNPVQLTAEPALDAEGRPLLDPEGRPLLVLKYRGVSLSEHGDGLEIFLEGSSPVTVELLDFEGAGEHWTVSATPRGNASTTSNQGDTWERAENLCRTCWLETPSEVEIVVTATNGASAPKPKPIFIKVLPEGARPWP
jgi:hypothetical protein